MHNTTLLVIILISAVGYYISNKLRESDDSYKALQNLQIIEEKIKNYQLNNENDVVSAWKDCGKVYKAWSDFYDALDYDNQHASKARMVNKRISNYCYYDVGDLYIKIKSRQQYIEEGLEAFYGG